MTIDLWWGLHALTSHTIKDMLENSLSYMYADLVKKLAKQTTKVVSNIAILIDQILKN